jgi:hypothetical protein
MTRPVRLPKMPRLGVGTVGWPINIRNKIGTFRLP